MLWMSYFTKRTRTALPIAAQLQVTKPTTPRTPPARLHRVRGSWFVIGAVFGAGIALFLNFLITAFILPQYRNLMTLDAPTQVAEIPAIHVQATPKPKPITYPRTLALKVDAGDTLMDMLMQVHVPRTEAHEVVTALRPEFNPRALRVGQKISLTLARHEKLGDKAAVKELAIKLPNFTTVALEREADGAFAVEAMREIMETKPHHAVGKVRSSLYQAAADAGIPLSAMNELVRAYSYDVDFQRDIHPGDTIEVLLDRETTKSGQVAGHKNVRYAALTLRGKKMEIYRFRDTSGVDGWFDAKGNSVKKSLLKTPMHAARISSGFGMRRHPVLGYSKMHRGVDFAAPTGTPILAAGDGVVSFRGWQGGYGNYLKISHNGTYSTAYGHISRFHPSVKQGSRVKQGQVIAYVGSTGMSTGPHLHFEVLQNGAQVNPTAQKFNTSQALAGAQLQRFKANMAKYTQEIAALNAPPKPAPQKLAKVTPSGT